MKLAVRYPEQVVLVGNQMRCLGLLTKKYVGDGLALVRRERRDKDQRLNAIVAARPHDGARIRMCNKDDWSVGPLKCPFECGHVVRQRCQWNRSSRGL